MIGHLTSFAAAARSFAIAVCIITVLHDEENPYPAYGPAREFNKEWILPLVFRNILATWAICGFWDWFLYFSPLKEKLHKFKINPKYPSFHQMKNDVRHFCSVLTLTSLQFKFIRLTY